ncbi:MAG: DUF4231 domain-containing protein [Alphaproteobacteria bacterium]|nr:DUF4231 domain-containing protein [Alphaproteobacteria bacterium]
MAAKAELLQFASTEAVTQLYAERAPVLRAVTPLAEGTDRIFGAEAIKLGYQIVCPMPFAQEEFERDFEPPHALEAHSREAFRDLLKQAAASGGLVTFELDGERARDEAAYSLAGDVVLNQSDVLIVVWDGHGAAGAGGTVETMQAAVMDHVLVVWIDALEPQRWQLIQSAADLPRLEGRDRCIPRCDFGIDPAESRRRLANAARRTVLQEVELADPDNEVPGTGPRARLMQYFGEVKPALNTSIAWRLFYDAVGSGRLRWPQILVPDFEDQSSPSDHCVDGLLRPHFAWADRLAELYADAYRSAYLMTYLFSASAVLVALLPYAMGWGHAPQIVCVGVEFVFMLTIVLLLLVGRSRRWHERWLEYRLLAELIRQLGILIPLGGGRPFPRLPDHLGSYGAPSRTWTYWQMRAVARAAGLPQAKVSPEFVRGYLDDLAEVVDGPSGGQRKFHADTATRAEHVAHRLHVAATSLFVITIAAVTMHAMLDIPSVERALASLNADVAAIGRWLVLASATLPAFGAAFAGINNHGEFARVAKRSAAMAEIFRMRGAQIAALRDRTAAPARLAEIVPVASAMADAMVGEVADWRAVFIQKPQTLA